MKKTILSLTLLLLVFSFNTAQKRDSIKQVNVTAGTISSRPAGKSYVVDLTRKGTIYTLATGIDYSRVQVRTAKGEVAIAGLVKRLGGRGKLLLGTLSDMRQLNLAPVAGTLGFTCDSAVCGCKGELDCNNMFSSNVCGDEAICDETQCACRARIGL